MPVNTSQERQFNACEQAVLTTAVWDMQKEYHVERLMREVMIPRIAPVSREMIFNFISEKVWVYLDRFKQGESKMRFWFMEDFRNPVKWRRPFTEFYQQILEQVKTCESLGYDNV